jgi:hypothetical protein
MTIISTLDPIVVHPQHLPAQPGDRHRCLDSWPKRQDGNAI